MLQMIRLSCVGILLVVLFSEAVSVDKTNEQVAVLNGLVQRAQVENDFEEKAKLARKSLLDIPLERRLNVMKDVLFQVTNYNIKFIYVRKSTFVIISIIL